MAKTLLNKVTSAIKKASDTVSSLKKTSSSSSNSNTSSSSSNSNSSNNSSNSTSRDWWISETGAPKGDIGTGNGISPTTGEKTYASSSASSSNGGALGTSTNYGSYEDDLKRLTEARRKAQINQLKQARQKALDNLDVQEQEIKPMYQNQRNLASASSQQGARSFSEYLANRGLTNSGASAQAEINRQSSLQNTLGNIGVAEADAYRDIANQRTAVENDYVSNLANANSAIDSEYYNNLLNYNQQQREMIQQLKLQSLGQYSNDYQAQINNLLAQGYSPNSLEVLQLQALRGNKVLNNYSNANTPANALASIQSGNINYNNASALGWSVDQAQNYYNNLVLSQQAQAQAEAERLAYERAQQEIENSQKWAQINNDIRNTNSLIASRQNSGSSSSSRTSSSSGNKQSISKSFANNILLNEGYFDYTDDSPSGYGTLTNSQYAIAARVYEMFEQGLSNENAKEILAENGFTLEQISGLFKGEDE